MILPWVTLFPGAMIPLHIFEERYRRMCADALSGNRMFVIAHADPGGELAPLGCLGVIRACVTNPDGTSHLVLQGVARVELSDFSPTPYPSALVEVLPVEPHSDQNLPNLRSRLLETCKASAKLGLPMPEGFEKHLHSVPDPGAFADLVAAALVADPVAKRRLLEELSIADRTRMLIDCLEDMLRAQS